jgi:dGTPase
MSTPSMYSRKDEERIASFNTDEKEEYRSEWRRDYARIIHSPSFRRLKGKTQLYPSIESDFFRNRLTHSLEVAQIAKSIAIRLNKTFINDPNLEIDTDIIEMAGVAHDLGHPPFGHIGEMALDKCMLNYGGFEGNAQTLRILTKLEKKHLTGNNHIINGIDNRVGLNLTYRSLASIFKYDKLIPITKKDRIKIQAKNKLIPLKGYYHNEKDIVKKIKNYIYDRKKVPGKFQTIECQIMEIADDIAYSTYDLEDAFKAGFLTPFDIVYADDAVIKEVCKEVSKSLKRKIKIFEIRNILSTIFKNPFVFPKSYDSYFYGVQVAYQASLELASNGYHRVKFTSSLVNKFINGINFELNKKIPALSKVWLEEQEKEQVEILKKFVYKTQILSPRLKITEHRGKEIIHKIFNTLSENMGYELMPADYQELYRMFRIKKEKMRIICDFISGMTDRYAIEFYGRLTSENPETIFKPL